MHRDVKYSKGYKDGKQEVIDAVNQAIKVFWEVWKTSENFKHVVMKDVYTSLNRKREKHMPYLEEIIVVGFQHRGPGP